MMAFRFLWYLCLLSTSTSGVVSAMTVSSQPKPSSASASATTVLSTTPPDQQQQEQEFKSPLLDPWREFDVLRTSQLKAEAVQPFFAERPTLVAQRLWKVSSTLLQTQRDWQSFPNETNLCQQVSSLGPLAVKIGQTLSQRPDLVGKQAADALQRLQTNNVPFDNELAYAVLQESFQTNYIAPGIGRADNTNTNNKPIFASMTRDPVACASLGQVYKATSHDGKSLAVKVQRPDAMAILALDAHCFRLAFGWREFVTETLANAWQSVANPNHMSPAQSEKAARGNKQQTIGTIIDRVARDILDEIDYRIEADHSAEFRDSLQFLGFVTTPTVVQATPRVLVTEWIPGQHLSKLNTTEQGLAMTRMAVEACTASLVLTGFVHADPHEGNLMLHEDGRVVFLDFGLMSRVDQTIMEGFARGIQALLAEDWKALTEAFVDVGFVTEPIMHRNGLNDTWRVDPEFGLPELAQELEQAMESTKGGKARFGALATVLNKKISPRWLVFTPPFVLLLIRTFLTLEGIAAKVDPQFNIYEMAMPWAIRRSLSPSTQKGIDVFRSTFMTPDNRIQWARLVELTIKNEGEKPDVTVIKTETTVKDLKQEAAKKAAMNDAVGSLMGSTEGKALRRALHDLDTVDLIERLATKDGRKLLRKAADVAANKVVTTDKQQPEALQELVDQRPASKESTELRRQQDRWKKRVIRLLAWSHIKRQLGFRGVVSAARLSFRFFRLSLRSVFRALKGRFTAKEQHQ